METLDARTVVYVPPEEAFEFLLDFTGYARYSAYLDEVRKNGDEGVGTTYEIVVSWWKLSYTARSRVTGIDRPRQIDWELLGGAEASGHWLVEDVSGEVDGREAASRITLHVEYDPESARDAGLNVPRFVPLGRIVDRVVPLARREAERVVERVVADLEGRRRAVDLTIET